MMRLIGILTGSALSVALLIVAVGIPELAPRTERAAAAVEQLPDTAETAAPPVANPVLPETEPPVPLEATPTPPAREPADVALPQPEPRPDAAPAAAAPAQSWYAFWSPFRSRVAADGFVAELQRTTGLDYRVVRLEPGVYEVAFAYGSDADIEEKLARISTATGLDVSGGS